MNTEKQTDRQLLLDNGYEDVYVFENPSYDGALIGVTSNERAVYDFNLMVESLIEEEGWSEEDALDWIDYNAVGVTGNEGAPQIMYRLERDPYNNAELLRSLSNEELAVWIVENGRKIPFGNTKKCLEWLREKLCKKM